MIKIIISTRHAAATNVLLLPPPSPRCRLISKRAAATAKTARLPSCRLHRQAGCRHRAAAAATSAATLSTPCYHCLLLTNLFFTTMVTAAHSDNGRNQLTCIEKDKPKNNNKIRQHEKNKPIFQFLPSLILGQTLFFSNNHDCNCHCRPLQQPPVMHAASPLPPLPPSPINYHCHRDN